MGFKKDAHQWARNISEPLERGDYIKKNNVGGLVA
jgi:hypothetical protein